MIEVSICAPLSLQEEFVSVVPTEGDRREVESLQGRMAESTRQKSQRKNALLNNTLDIKGITIDIICQCYIRTL